MDIVRHFQLITQLYGFVLDGLWLMRATSHTNQHSKTLPFRLPVTVKLQVSKVPEQKSNFSTTSSLIWSLTPTQTLKKISKGRRNVIILNKAAFPLRRWENLVSPIFWTLPNFIKDIKEGDILSFVSLLPSSPWRFCHVSGPCGVLGHLISLHYHDGKDVKEEDHKFS